MCGVLFQPLMDLGDRLTAPKPQSSTPGRALHVRGLSTILVTTPWLISVQELDTMKRQVKPH